MREHTMDPVGGERRQDPAVRPRSPLFRVLLQPWRQHRPAARGGRPSP